MTDENIFGSGEVKPATNGDQPTGQNNQPPVDYNAMFKDHLSSIKNEKGEQKYTDVKAALEALRSSQEHIKNLENENRTYRESQTRQETIEEALERLATNRNQNTQPSTNSGKKEIDVEELRRIAREETMLVSKERQVKDNKKQVSDTLVNKFGGTDKAKKAFSDKAEELGVSAEFLQELAGNSPKAVLAYFNATSSNGVNKNIKGTVNTESFNSMHKDKPDMKIKFGATTKDLMSAWNATKENVLAELNN